MKSSKEAVEKLAFKFEQKYGTELLCKCGLSALNRLLIDKGILTEDELLNALVNRLEQYIIDLKQIDQKTANK